MRSRPILSVMGVMIALPVTVCSPQQLPEQSPPRQIESRKAYLDARRQLIGAEFAMRTGGDVELSPTEKVADEVLATYRNAEKQRNPFLPAEVFLRVRTEIADSPLFLVLRRMPKGGMLHAHSSASGDFRWLISHATYLHNCHIYVGDTTPEATEGEFRFFKTPPNPKWKRVSKLRRQAADKSAFDEKLYQSITLGDEDLDNDPWDELELCFNRISGLIKYAQVTKEYYRTAIDSLIDDGVQHVEFRDSLKKRYDLDGNETTREEAAQLWKQLVDETKSKHPTFSLRIIYAKRRFESRDCMNEHLRFALDIREKHPDLIAGFDLVGAEDGHNSILFYLDEFLSSSRRARESAMDLPYFFHAGESNWSDNENMIDAILLGSRRIGHGYAVSKHPLLMNMVKKRGIALEVCPISNQCLGYVKDLRNHPAAAYLARGIPVVLCPDDPGMMRCVYTHDYYEACLAWDLDIGALKQLARNSLVHSALPEDEKDSALEAWELQWDSFVSWLSLQKRAVAPPSS